MIKIFDFNISTPYALFTLKGNLPRTYANLIVVMKDSDTVELAQLLTLCSGVHSDLQGRKYCGLCGQQG